MVNAKVLAEMKKRFNGCELMQNRNKGDFDAVVGEVLTVEDYQRLTGEDGNYYAVVFEEDADNFYLSGGALTEMLETWGEDNGCVGVKVSFGEKVKTKAKRDYRPMTICD